MATQCLEFLVLWDLELILQPMAETGKEATGSMGDDTAPAVLSYSYRPMSHFFRQNFSQVTNPPVDPLREARVMSRMSHPNVVSVVDFGTTAHGLNFLVMEHIDGHTLEDLEAAILEEIATLQREPPSAAELNRIKTKVVADSVYERDSMFYQGMIIGTLESVGLDWRLNDEYADRIKAVTPQQVSEVAQKYLVPERLTIAKLVPVTTGENE